MKQHSYFGKSIQIGFLIISLISSGRAGRAATFVWSGGGANANWSTPANWSGGTAPANDGTATIILAGTTQLSPVVNAAWDVSSLAFSTNAGAFTLSGSALTIRAGGIFNSNANAQTIGNAITLFTNQTWTAASNALILNGNINLNNGTNRLTVSGGFNTTLAGVISGSGGLTKAGAGILFLSASNSYSGLTTVSTGVINLQNAFALGATNSGTTISSGAVLQLQGDIGVSGEALSISGTGITNGGALRNVSGSNSWNGTITLAANSTLSADTGTLYLGADIVNSNRTVTFTNNGTIILAGTLGSGTGGLTKIGAGTLVVNSTNTYTGATTVNGGSLQFGATGSLPPTSAVTVNAAGTMDLNNLNKSILSLAGAGSVTLGSGALSVNNNAATSFSGILSGTGSLIKAGGTNTLTLSGVNTYTGGTVINAGVISIKADNNLGNTNSTLTLNGGQLLISATVASTRPVILGASNGVINSGSKILLTLGGTISGPGALTKIGTGGLTLTGTNTYSGGTTNGAGTITINSDAALGDASTAVVFPANATLTTTASFASARNLVLISGTATYNAGTGFTNTLNGGISGAGAFIKAGSGVLLMNGSSTFTNLLNISAGTLRLGANERFSDLMPVLISATTATFDLNNFNETIGSLASSAGKVTLGSGFLTAGGNNLSTTNLAVISGTGGFTKAGNGTMLQTGANTYTNTTTIAAGTFQLGASERIANTSPLVINGGATFNQSNWVETVASLAGAGSVILGSGTNIAGSAASAVFSGTISGTGAFTKIGAGTQVFSGTNSYSGATTVSAGNLQVNGSSTNSAVTVASKGTLSGNGSVGAVAINLGATNSPGISAPDTLRASSETWAGGGNHVFKINDAAGAKGANPGWNWLNISGTLTISATPGNKFNLPIQSLTTANVAGQIVNFDNTATYIWTIASASGGISGFNPANFNLVTNGFQNPLGAGKFAITQSGNDLNLVFSPAAQPAVKGVQSGELTSTGNGTNIVTLGAAVNPASAFLIFSARHDSSAPGGSMVRGRITASNTVEFVRATTESSLVNIRWYVAEYSAGVRVQRGELNQTNTTMNVPLAPLAATGQAFVLWSKTPDPAETAFTDSDPLAAEITSVSNLQFRVTSAPSSVPVIAWQVVEFQNPAGIGVQRGSITNLTGTNLMATATLNSPVDPDATFVLAGYRTAGSGTAVGARMLRAQLTDASTITFNRSISGAPDDIAEICWQAVQLKDGSLVQSGLVNLPTGAAETNVVLATGLNTNRAIAFASAQPVAGQSAGSSPSTGSVPGVGSATLAMSDSSQLTIDRNNTSDQSDLGWSVVGLGLSSLLVPASGGSAISADTKGGDYTSLDGPSYTEIQSGNVGAGTIILKTPAGFIFDTNAPLPSVLVTRVDGTGADTLNINGAASGSTLAMTAITTNSLTFTVTAASSNGVECSLAWQNLRVRPTAGAPLTNGNLTYSGTSVIQGITTNASSWGFLAEVAGASSKLALTTKPSTNAIAGVDFDQQPVIQIQDQFGNLCDDDTTAVTVTNSGTGLLNGATNLTAINGIVAFSGLDYEIASTIKLGFAAPGLTGTNSANIVVGPAAASHLTISNQPSASVIAGVAFPQQPTIRVEDEFGNLRSADNNLVITADIGSGNGDLFGTLTASTTNGLARFTNLNCHLAETVTLVFTSGSLDPDTSANVVVNAAPARQLAIQTQPSATATAGVPFARQPVVQVLDQFGNLCVTNNSTVITAARNTGSGSGTLQGALTATASGGVASFANLAHNIAGVISIDFNSGVLTNTTSDSIQVNSSAAAQLAFATQPGAATVGSAFGTQPVVVTKDIYGNDSAAGLAANLPVTIALVSGTGTLLGVTNLDLGAMAGNGTATFTDLQIDSAGSKQLIASAGLLTSALSTAFNVGQGSQTITFAPLGGKIYGAAPFSLTAGASSGQAVAFSILAGPATVASSNLTILGAGTVTVRASQPGNADYLAATPVDQSFAVTAAALTITADNQSRAYGAPNPAFTATYSGLVNGDTTNSLGGAPAFSTTAVSNSPVAGNPYPIQVANGTLQATNYNLTFVPGTLTITQAGFVIALTSSANPAGYKDSVNFSATVPADATGTMLFLTNATAFSTNNIAAGNAVSASVNVLPRGTNTVTARYSGDGNYLPATNLLSQVVTNHPPVANLAMFQRTAGLRLKIAWADVATNWSDVDGDPVTVSGVNLVTTNAVNLTTNSTFIFYTNSPDVNDRFTYSISDGQGGTNLGAVVIVVLPFVTGQQSAAVSIGGGTANVTFHGIPDFIYVTQRSTNLLAGSGWVNISTNTTPANGVFSVTDNFNDLGGPPASAYYRLRWAP